MLPHAALFVVLGLGALAGTQATVRVTGGRAELVLGREPLALTPSACPRALAAPAYVELGARSTLELRWSGLASAAISGPAALEVGPGERPRLQLLRLARAEIEVRRGTLALELPGGGLLALAHCALGLRALSDGRIELQHRGGAPVRILRPGARRELWLRPGERLRLAAPAP
jgi:hypothetical protein